MLEVAKGYLPVTKMAVMLVVAIVGLADLCIIHNRLLLVHDNMHLWYALGVSCGCSIYHGDLEMRMSCQR